MNNLLQNKKTDNLTMKSLNANLILEWHPTRNQGIVMSQISNGSGKKIWWVCEKGHEWEAMVLNRSKGQGCPYCAGKKVLSGFNDLYTTHPKIASEWHPTKNYLKPEQVSRGSTKKIWWLGECGHEWEAMISNRSSSNSTGCPYCANLAILVGFNDLATTHPEIAKDWDFDKNSKSPREVTYGYNRSVWWVCEKEHSYTSSVINRVYKGGCPYCSSHQVLIGFNDLATTHPEIAKTWSFKNRFFSNSVTAGSGKKVWWQCDKGHEWKTSVASRRSTGCPYCSGRYVISGENDLSTLFPEIASQFSEEKNASLSPENLSAFSNKKVWWKDSYGHEWKTAISHRTARKQGCPICSNKKVLPGFNDFSTTHPELVKEWHPTLNDGLTPDMITAGSDKRIWWLCDKGHEWETWAHVRKANHGCPKCLSGFVVSQAETEIYEYLTSLGEKVIINDRLVLFGKEIDLYLPERKIGIEFNGIYWHSEVGGKGKNYHYEKYSIAKQKEIRLIQIWEDDWNLKKEIVKKMLSVKIGASMENKIFARKLKNAILETSEVKPFLEKTHIQGFVAGSYYLGLKDNENNLKAVLVLKKRSDKTLEIVRYSTSESTLGGFTKLLKFAENLYNPKKFITFSDNTVSDGGLYEKNGFVVDKIIPPDYMYVFRNVRYHKFNFRLKRFQNDESLKYLTGLTEKELATLNKIHRIWDAGKVRYVRTNLNIDYI